MLERRTRRRLFFPPVGLRIEGSTEISGLRFYWRAWRIPAAPRFSDPRCPPSLPGGITRKDSSALWFVAGSGLHQARLAADCGDFCGDSPSRRTHPHRSSHMKSWFSFEEMKRRYFWEMVPLSSKQRVGGSSQFCGHSGDFRGSVRPRCTTSCTTILRPGVAGRVD